MTKETRKVHKIDATGQAVGRLATQVALILRGKNKPSFKPYLDEGDGVIVENVSKLKFTGKKMEQKKYWHHTGYPGGMKSKPMKEVEAGEILRRAVWNMLPKNKLRDLAIKRLEVRK